MASYEIEQARLQKLLDEMLFEDLQTDNPIHADEGPFDKSDTEESDHEEVIDESSDSEQDIDDADGSTDEYYMTGPSFIAKNKTYWKKHKPPIRAIRTRQENIIKRLPSPTQATKVLKRPIEIWNYFFTEEIISEIVMCTNLFIEKIRNNYTRERDANKTDANEIRAMLGLIYMAGVTKSNKLNLEDLWRRDGYGIEIFCLTMSLQRFRFLLRCVRFDNIETRAVRRELDKLAPIRKIFELFVSHCEKGYHHSDFVTIDEMLPAFRGRCAFRQYMPKKPTKYGMKVFAMCDAKMFYTSKLEVYVGVQPDGPYKLSNASDAVVTRMCRHISGSGRNVTMDNWFMSVPLVQKLRNDFKLTTFGTIKKIGQVCRYSLQSLLLDQYAPVCLDLDKTVPCFPICQKKNKNILLVSSYHKDDEIDESTGNLNKPAMITDYNKTKGGVDTVDKLCASYNCARATRRWPMVVFYLMLNIAGINSQVIFCANNPNNKIIRRHFLRDLANDLIKPQLATRACLAGLPRILKLRLQEITGIESTAAEVNVPPGRCVECGWRKNRKTRFSCYQCHIYMCLEHLTPVCSRCKQPSIEVE
ncbi:hypothetical protein FQR65_LT20793 [Abscondita terminalis]|nr:hypothetical protein FQR65_LT20793 [Abscondita terminalis]